MTAPVVHGMGAMASSTGTQLKVALPSRAVDDLIVLSATGYHAAAGSNGTLPNIQSGYHILASSASSAGWDVLAWKRAKGGEADPVVVNNPGMPATGWILRGHVEVYSGVDYHDPGWLDVPGTAGNYATVTRTALTTATNLTVAVRVAFDALGVTNWAFGWANGDLGFGLNPSNQMVIYATNTVGGIIGNAPATFGIPGLGAKRKLWLYADLTTTTAQCNYQYSFDDVEHWESVHWQGLDIRTGTNAGTTMRMTNSGTAFVGALNASTTPTGQDFYSLYERTEWNEYNNWTLSDPNPPGFARVGTIAVQRPTVGNSSPVEDFDRDQTPLPQPLSIQARRVYGADRLVVNVFTGTSTVAQTPNPVTGPPGWRTYSDRAYSGTKLFARDITRSIIAQAWTDPAQTTTSSTKFSYGFYGVTLRPTPQVALPLTSPQPPRLVLGCPDTYTTWITDGSYQRQIEQLRWSNITWERVLDQISSAQVTIPDEYGGVNCLARAGGLAPWRYGLRIERNDQQVWSGPIVTVARKDDAIVVSASDVFARYQKRFLIRRKLIDYDNVDAAVIFRDVITTWATSELDLWNLPVPEVHVNVTLTRSLKPREFKYAWDLMSELLNSSIDAYIMNGVLYMWQPGEGWQYQQTGTTAGGKRTLPGTYNPDADLVYGTFTEESFATRPNWTLDGTTQTNYAVVPGADTGEFGFRTYAYAEDPVSQDLYGLLDSVDPDAIQVPADTPDDQRVRYLSDALAARANTILALRSTPPITIEGGVLSQQAPVSADHLRPGSLWKLDVFDEGFGQLLSLLRLRRVSVSVTRSANGVEEKVSPVLEPPGATGQL